MPFILQPVCCVCVCHFSGVERLYIQTNPHKFNFDNVTIFKSSKETVYYNSYIYIKVQKLIY
jgi:hypothetical protein